MKEHLCVNKDVEMALLSVLMEWQDIDQIIDEIEKEDFFFPSHQVIFETIKKLYFEDKRIDPILIYDEIKDQGKLKEIGQDYLFTIFEYHHVNENAKDYIKILKQLSKKRRYLSISEEIQRKIKNNEDISEIEKLFDLDFSDNHKVTLKDAVSDVLKLTMNPVLMEPGIKTPWHRVNTLTRGFRKGWLTYIAGYPAHGKTASVMHIATTAAKAGHKVLFISLEMSPEELAVRFSQTFGLDTERFYEQKTTEEDFNSVANAFNECPYIENVIIEQKFKIDEIVMEVKKISPNMLIIDYLQLLDIDAKTLREGITKNSRELKKLAEKAQIPVVCVSQLARPSDKDRVPIPTIYSLKESGSIENDANQIIFVWRKQDINSKLPSNEGSFIVAKSRMGEVGRADFIFDGKKQQFNLY